jgi:hypothetical protein
VPLTVRLAAGLRDHRHLRGDRVLCQCAGAPLTQKIVQDHVRRSVRRVQLAKSGVHRLRHTFCSHLARRHERFTSWLGIKIWSRRSGTCTSDPIGRAVKR